MNVTGRYKVFPPKWRHIRVPTTSRPAALAGLALYAPCRRRGIWLQRLAWWAVGLLGPGILPGRAIPFEPPDLEVWAELQKRWTEQLGPFDELAVVERRQSKRPGLGLLLMSEGEPIAFVRARQGLDPATDGEVTASRLLRDRRPRVFRVPGILALGQVGDWGYVASSPLPPAPHRPPREPPLAAIIEEIQHGLDALPRPDGTPGGWVPIHGDLTPWNLRLLSDGTLVLLDWERVGWGPRGADELLYHASEVALGWRAGVGVGDHDAARFWQSRSSESIEDEVLNKVLDEVVAGTVA